MKPIKIIESNIDAISAALDAANGKSITHTFSASEILALITTTEKKLFNLVTKKLASGATCTARSGDALPNGYKYSRSVNLITIERRSTHWYLTKIDLIHAYKDGEWTRLRLTSEQDIAAVARFRQEYAV